MLRVISTAAFRCSSFVMSSSFIASGHEYVGTETSYTRENPLAREIRTEIILSETRERERREAQSHTRLPAASRWP
jgi:hypothetical protein